MKAVCSTNGLLARVRKDLEQLIEWADEDAQSSLASALKERYRSDMSRGTSLRRALSLLADCGR